MARTFARTKISRDPSSPNPYYYLLFNSSVMKLRRDGFFGGFDSLKELEHHCIEVFKRAHEEKHDLQCIVRCQSVSAGVESTEGLRLSAESNQVAPARRLDDFFIYDSGGICVPIEQVPYEGDPIDEDLELPRYYVATISGGLVSEIQTWKVELEENPFFLVKDVIGDWIELRKPAKRFTEFFRCALLVARKLCFLKNCLPCSKEAARDHFSSYAMGEANENDLLQQHVLVEKVLNGDTKLKSMLNVKNVFETFGLLDRYDSAVTPPIQEHLDGSYVCAICDDGGNLVCCEGVCLRSFHPTPEPSCPSICLPDTQDAHFICLNCKYSQHQCFKCGKLGFSSGSKKEVYKCSVQNCGCFYHLSCLPRFSFSKRDQKVFRCPLHKCAKCKLGDEGTKLFPCRRCPRSWHRHCIADKIRFQDDIRPLDDLEEVRGWVVPTTFLYCLKHELDPSLGAPPWNKIIFPQSIMSA